ncbi:MAG: hypothetical protein HYY84_14710 [Deltaproteobacteria bacterium]|nr:hypothetical protein [Deltaproteobacteria bacterium]
MFPGILPRTMREFIQALALLLLLAFAAACGKSNCERYCEKLALCGLTSPATAEDCRNACNRGCKNAPFECVNSHECADVQNGLCGDTNVANMCQ